jgi:hypothetical protein
MTSQVFTVAIVVAIIAGFVFGLRKMKKTDAATIETFVGEPPADSGSLNPLGPDAPTH